MSPAICKHKIDHEVVEDCIVSFREGHQHVDSGVGGEMLDRELRGYYFGEDARDIK